MTRVSTLAPSFEQLLSRADLAWMGQNTTHLEPPAEVIEALRLSIERREFQLYAPPMGLTRLGELILDDLGLPDAGVLVTDGAVAGLHHICTALAPGLSQLITTDPGWPWPARFVQLAGVPVTTVDVYNAEHGYRLSADQLAEVITPASLIYLIDPLNPLGSSYGADELSAIAEIARASGSLIVHDCTYRHFATGHTLLADLYPEGVLTTYSFSKWLGLAGLRLGAIVARPDLLETLSAVPSNPLGSNICAQRAAIAGLEVKGPWLKRLRATNVANQHTVIDAIEASGLGRVLVPASHGNFLAVDIAGDSANDVAVDGAADSAVDSAANGAADRPEGGGWTADGVAATMLEHDIFIRSGTYQSPHFGQRFVKISTSVPTEWAQRLAQSWAALADLDPR